MFDNLRRIYIPNQLSVNKMLNIESGPILNRFKNVLRLKAGDRVRIFNQNDGEYLATLDKINNKLANFTIGKLLANPGKHQKITLLIPIIKPDRLKWLVEKATELGVSEFIFYKPSRAQSWKANIEKIHQYIIGACEQSERIDIPEIETCSDIQKYISQSKQQILLCNENEKEQYIFNACHYKPSEGINLMFGPEGGFSSEEMTLYTKHKNVSSVHLGKNVLRVETAVIFALANIYTKLHIPKKGNLC